MELILLCLLMSTQHRMHKFWLGIQWADLKVLKWDQYPIHDKHFPFPNNVFISFRCQWMSTLLDDPNALCWEICCSWILLDIIQASRFSLLGSRCGLLFAGCWRRVLLECSKMGISISNYISRRYHGFVDQLGTTMIPMATSKTIWCNTFPIIGKGGNG